MKESSLLADALIVLTLHQTRSLLKELLEQELRPIEEALKSAYKHDLVEYLTTQQALDFLHLSKPTLNRLRREQKIVAYSSSDKRVLYKRSELAAYLEAAKQKGGMPSC